MNKWQDDLERSSRIILQARPIFKKMFSGNDVQIMQVENKEEEVCKLLDTTCGIDYFIIMTSGKTYGVAWRCQWVEPGKEFNSFTVRKARDTGAKTEFEKRKDAIEENAVYPYYVAQAFVNKYTNEILSLALTTTKDLINYVETHEVQTRHTGKEQAGQAEFYVAYWIDMALFGYHIITYSKEKGIR